MSKDYVVIMAGGGGTRFWPVSREQKPKQFLDITGAGQTLLQQTFERFRTIVPAENILVVTNERYRNLVKSQLPQLKNSQVIGEPVRRNTAPCICYAAYKIAARDHTANMVVAPSDHVIGDEKTFRKVIKSALKSASQRDHLITLGIKPTRPDTGYGYVQYIKGKKHNGVYKVKTFTEKPNSDLAKTFLRSGDFLWNSGMFVWNVEAILKAFKKHLPDIYDVFEKGKPHYNTAGEKEFIGQAYTLCTNISIDYGVMEKAGNVYVIPAAFGWCDLGTWESLHQRMDKDHLGNAVAGKNVMIYDTSHCIIRMPEEKLAVLKGLENYIVVESDDILFIAPKDKAQNIKQVLADIKRYKGEQYL